MWEIIEGTRGEHDSRRYKDYDYTSRGPKMGYSSAHYGKKYDEEEVEEMLEEAYYCGYEEGMKKLESKHPSLSKLRERPIEK